MVELIIAEMLILGVVMFFAAYFYSEVSWQGAIREAVNIGRGSDRRLKEIQ